MIEVVASILLGGLVIALTYAVGHTNATNAASDVAANHVCRDHDPKLSCALVIATDIRECGERLQ